MFEDKIRKLNDRVEKLIKNNRNMSCSDVILFGSGDETRNLIKILKKFGITVCLVIDNSSEKDGSYCSGVPVKRPDYLNELSSTNRLFLLYSPYHNEMKNQLVGLGISETEIIVLYEEEAEKNIASRICDLFAGKRIYKKLRRKAGQNGTVFICPYTGTGDIYLIGTLIGYYLKQNAVSEYIFVVISGACAKVAKIFGIYDSVRITPDECRKLLFYYSLCPEECKIKILNDDWGDIYKIYNGPAKWVRGYKGQNFTDMFRRYVFDLPDEVKPEKPSVPDKSGEIKSMFDELGLIKDKTVILAPYSNTLADLPDDFWIVLSDKIKDNGLCPATNCGPGESEIPGTTKLSFSLDISIQILDYAGYFVGVRSGFCDIASGSDCKKIILYDKNNTFSMSSAYDYFSLNKMGLCDDAIEIQFDPLQSDKLIDRMINEL